MELLLFALVVALGSTPGSSASPVGAAPAAPPSFDVAEGKPTAGILPSEARDDAVTDRRLARGRTEQMPGSAGGTGSAAGSVSPALLACFPCRPPPRPDRTIGLPAPDLPPGPGILARLHFPTGPPVARPA